MSKQSIQEMIYQETERRLAIMADSHYEFPSRIGKWDITAIVISIITCIVLILLCMMGGIK